MTNRLLMFQVDAFADRLFSGNPAAVLVIDACLPDRLMQAIAMENNLAETAFVRPGSGSFNLRWFTPVHEVDFCGHATLAAAHVLRTEYGCVGELTFSTRVGELRVRPCNTGYQLDLPRLDPDFDFSLPEIIGKLFHGKSRTVFRNFENIFVEMSTERCVRRFVPDLHALGRLHPLGLAITAAGDQSDFVSRYFAPAAGIPEDPVTGSTHATLVPYWAARLGKSHLEAEQCSLRGGRLDCTLATDRVLLGGGAVTFMRAEVYLP